MEGDDSSPSKQTATASYSTLANTDASD